MYSGKGNHSATDDRPVANSTNDTSISIEETNRIRAELGLKPLDIGGQNNDGETSTEKKDVHVPAGKLFWYIFLKHISWFLPTFIKQKTYETKKPQKN